MIASDFTDNSLTGITTVIGGFASVTKTLTNDISIEGAESFQVNIRFGSPSGTIVGTSPIISVADTSVPTYEVVPSALSINEEQSVTFTINTVGVPDNTTLYYTISGSSGLVAADFLDNALSGSFVINSSTGTITKTLSLDFTTEGNETFTLSVRRGSTSGTIIATSPTITIVDTSITPYEFTSFTFTNAGATGRTGPTLAQCLSSYNTTTYPWLTNTGFFNMVSQGKQLWTVKIGGVYQFDVRGARGGTYSNGGTTYVGAYGARIVSRVTLSVGQVIAIAVGQKGYDSATFTTAGGGSFVVLDSTSTPLVVAGGGAGAVSNGAGNLDVNAQGQTTTSGGPAYSIGGGPGTNGGGGGSTYASGGNAADGGTSGSFNNASGGAGFYGSGGDPTGRSGRGLKWSLGMLGGFGFTDSAAVGGFGGGAGQSANTQSAGGAGGYSGGGGTYEQQVGSGGGSFTTSSFSGTNITATRGFNSDHGSVSVTLISITESYNTRPSTQNANEGTIVTFRTDTVGVANTTLYYTISGSSGLVAADFTDNALTGSFNVVSGVGITTKTLSNDLSISEGTESFYMDVRTGSTSGTVVTTSPTVLVYDTSNATFNITPSVSFLNEGGSVGFAVTTTNIPDNTTLYYSISGSAGISTSDFTDNTLTGSFNIISNSATVTKTLANDLSSNEGIETFNMSIRVGSTSGQITTTSSNVTIYDTSISPYVVTPSTLSVNEGSSVIFTTTTTAIPDTTLYYNISGSAGISASDFTSNSLTGSFPLVSGVGSTTLTLSNDLTTEGTETFYMNIRTGSTSGSIVGVSSSVTITDTSLTPDLYAFTTQTFTNAGATGANGPTLSAVRSAYGGTWQQNSAYLNVTNGTQQWTCPTTGTYRITCMGANGGSNIAQNAGRGASIITDVTLVQSTVYNIIVGQCGQSGGNNGGHGAGGSFVFTGNVGTGELIVAAGGGGGTGHDIGFGGNGSQTGSPTTGGGRGTGTSQGMGYGGNYFTGDGGQGNWNGPAGGGAGWFSDGTDARTHPTMSTYTNKGFAGSRSGVSIFGGVRQGRGDSGGFGGGGAAGGDGVSGGGGGGYSGGGGGANWPGSGNPGHGGGGGGGSYWTGSLVSATAGGNTAGNVSSLSNGFNSANGFVTITKITPSVAMYLDAGNVSSYPGSGTTWTDLSGNGKNGTLTNGPTYSSANSGSIVFDGTDDYVTTSSSVLPSPNSSPLTLEAVCMNTSGSGWQTVLGTHSSFTQIGFNGTTLYFGRNGGGGNILLSSGASVSTNTWCHIVMTYDGSLAYVYLNGSFITSGNIGSNGQTNGVSLLSTFTSASPSERFTGRIAVARVYNGVLSSSEVSQNFNALRGRYGI
jgi:hypothetical protein